MAAQTVRDALHVSRQKPAQKLPTLRRGWPGRHHSKSWLPEGRQRRGDKPSPAEQPVTRCRKHQPKPAANPG
eukprot:10925850-Lingulodinium_polyedra.AAC.1